MQTHYVEILSVVPCTLLLAGVTFAVGVDPYLRRQQKRAMLEISALVFTLIAQNLLDYLLTTGKPAIGVRIANSVYGYSVRPVILLLFLHVVRPERRYRWEWAVVGVNTAIYSTAFFSDICFTIDAQNYWQGGYPLLRSSCLITSLVFLVELVYLTIRAQSSSTWREIWIPLFVTAIILLALLADSHIGDALQPESFLTIAIVTDCTLYYFWLHLQFVREHEQALASEQRIQIMLTQFAYTPSRFQMATSLPSPTTA